MIQFNLLPDIKIQFLKAQRQKRLFILISTIVIIASITVLVLLAVTVFGVQRKSINDLTNDIASASEELQSTEDLSKILTVQNQLNVLPELHNEKPVAGRLFGYLNDATPNNINIARAQADFTTNTLTLSGGANALEDVNQFIDTLKFTNFTTNGDDERRRAFSGVVLSNFGRDATAATYTIELTFEPIIFSEQHTVALIVPNIITTRSEVAQPQALFEE